MLTTIPGIRSTSPLGLCWLLVHVEIQGDYEKEFPERMFEYHSAIRKMYNHPVDDLRKFWIFLRRAEMLDELREYLK